MYFCPVDGILFTIVIIVVLIAILSTLRQLASLVSLSITVFLYVLMQAIQI